MDEDRSLERIRADAKKRGNTFVAFDNEDEFGPKVSDSDSDTVREEEQDQSKKVINVEASAEKQRSRASSAMGKDKNSGRSKAKPKDNTRIKLKGIEEFEQKKEDDDQGEELYEPKLILYDDDGKEIWRAPPDWINLAALARGESRLAKLKAQYEKYLK